MRNIQQKHIKQKQKGPFFNKWNLEKHSITENKNIQYTFSRPSDI